MLQNGNNNSQLKRVLFFSFLLLYTGVMLWLCNELNIWMDEAYTLDTTSAKYKLHLVIKQSYYFESQPPVYFILLSLWRKLNDGVFFARLFSLINIGLSAWFFYRLSNLIRGVKTSRWVLILFLLNPFVIWAGLEIRLYAFLLLLSVLLIYFFFRYYISEKKKYLYLFLFISAIGLYTQYFFAFLIAALVFASLLFKGWKIFFKFSLYLIPVILIFLPNVMLMADQLGMVQSLKLQFSTMQRIDMVFHSPQNLMLAMEKLYFARELRWVILLLFILLIAWSYLKGHKQNRLIKTFYFRAINLSILTSLAVIIMLAVVMAVTKIDYEDRYLIIALPLFILVFTLIDKHTFVLSRFIYILLTLFFSWLFFYIYYYSNPVKQYDYKGVAKYISLQARREEPILFYQSTISLPFGYYYKGSNPLIPLPHQVQFDTTYMNPVKDTFELKQSIDNIKGASRSYLLISDLNEAMYNGNENRKMVNDYINNHYSITMDTLFFGLSKKHSLRVRRVEKK